MRWTFTILLIALVTGLGFACRTPKTNGWAPNYSRRVVDMTLANRRTPKEVKKYLEDMSYIPGGTFTMGSEDALVFTDKDSTLLPRTFQRRSTVSNFYLSDHEVTNAEYREFVRWVRDSVAMLALAEKDPSWYDKEKRTLNWAHRQEIWLRDSTIF